MSERFANYDDERARIVIAPEPTAEEFVAILEALRAIDEAAEPGPEVESGSNWERIARREALRSSDWPPQQLAWSQGRG